jgi:hypothetical protein
METSNRRGQALVETALLLPVMILILSIIFYFMHFIRKDLQLHLALSQYGRAVAAGKTYRTGVWLDELRKYFLHESGITVPKRDFQSIRWRAYEFPTVRPLRTPGHLAHIQITSLLNTPPIFPRFDFFTQLRVSYDTLRDPWIWGEPNAQ